MRRRRSPEGERRRRLVARLDVLRYGSTAEAGELAGVEAGAGLHRPESGTRTIQLVVVGLG